MSVQPSNTPATATKGERSFSRLVMSPLKRLRDFISPPESHDCVLCPVSNSRPRLVAIINALPPGDNFCLPRLREIIGGSFRELHSDLDYLQKELKLPLERTRRGVILTAKVHICEGCQRSHRAFYL